ncbi:MAG: hypothetical protein Sapg2KO_46510 [Saprospiraceae bacterium]
MLTLNLKKNRIKMKMTSQQVREQIHQLSENGLKSEAIATQLKISIWTVRKWRQRLKKGAVFIRKWEGLNQKISYQV